MHVDVRWYVPAGQSKKNGGFVVNLEIGTACVHDVRIIPAFYYFYIFSNIILRIYLKVQS